MALCKEEIQELKRSSPNESDRTIIQDLKAELQTFKIRFRERTARLDACEAELADLKKKTKNTSSTIAKMTCKNKSMAREVEELRQNLENETKVSFMYSAAKIPICFILQLH